MAPRDRVQYAGDLAYRVWRVCVLRNGIYFVHFVKKLFTSAGMLDLARWAAWPSCRGGADVQAKELRHADGMPGDTREGPSVLLPCLLSTQTSLRASSSVVRRTKNVGILLLQPYSHHQIDVFSFLL